MKAPPVVSPALVTAMLPVVLAGWRFTAAAVLGAAIAATSASAEPVAVGLSPVAAQTFGNENLLFFVPEEYDRFGWSVAVGDFNADGAGDLAVGMPDDDGLVGSGLSGVGIVVVRWGVPGGPLSPGLADTVLSQFAAGSQGAPDSGDRFGASLAVGDFNGDGHDDLAVGVPGDAVPHPDPAGCGADFVTAGSAVIHYGLPSGIQTAGEHRASRASLFSCAGAHGDAFGSAVAAGDFDGDGWDDLAVGVPGFDFGLQTSSGAVYVFYGQIGGLVPWDGAFVSQSPSTVEDSAETGDELGAALAVGDLNGDLRDDLVVGVPGEDGSGAAHLFLGGAGGIVVADDRLLREVDIVGVAGAGDDFGAALALGDFDGDGFDDLAIGAPLADPGTPVLDSGRVSIVAGSSSILAAPLVASSFTQGAITGDPSSDGTQERFGRALAAGDFDADGLADLAAGAPGDNAVASANGAIYVLSGIAGSFPGARYRTFRPGQEGVPPSAAVENRMGFSLAVGDFDGDGHDDLATGLPQRDVDGLQELGAVAVSYGSLFADGFESASSAYWSATAP